MRFPLATRYADFDPKGHVNNAVYLTYFEMARHRAWSGAGGNANFPFILAEATVKFVSQARVEDALDIEISVGEVRSKAWVFHYVIRVTANERVVAEGSTVQVMYDYETQRTIPITDRIRAWLDSL
ncbi:MAG TPA: thioesterase family protein [Gemmatimonadaceae bacterium]|nr:thioesterase family protein [Gemmatimonadaceae bacterium]